MIYVNSIFFKDDLHPVYEFNNVFPGMDSYRVTLGKLPLRN